MNKPKILWEQLANTYHSKSLAGKLILKKNLYGFTTELALDAIIVCLLKTERLMMQESGDTYDRALMVTKATTIRRKVTKINLR